MIDIVYGASSSIKEYWTVDFLFRKHNLVVINTNKYPPSKIDVRNKTNFNESKPISFIQNSTLFVRFEFTSKKKWINCSITFQQPLKSNMILLKENFKTNKTEL